jgi:streptomycin 6-kinase
MTDPKWLDRLPVLLRECEQRWSLTIQAPFARLSYNYVAPAQAADGSPLVLKLGVPNPEFVSEIEALRVFDGRGAIRLIDADPSQGVLLLERANPGTPLMALTDDEEATSIASKVMRQLWRPAPADGVFPALERWFRALAQLRTKYDGKTGPLPSFVVEAAERSYADLIASSDFAIHGEGWEWPIRCAETLAHL